MQVKDRVYHSISIHAQANARWSYTDPPLAQIPRDLGYIYGPDKGWPWISWDQDQAETRLVACECKDPTMLEALKKGWDLHLLACCMMFEIPVPPQMKDPIHAPENAEWRREHRWLSCNHQEDICGKDDPRRHFSKTYGHRQSYGGTAKKAKDIPGARQLNLEPKVLIAMHHRRAALFPRLYQWQNETAEKGAKVGQTRDWYGRRRCYLSRGHTYLRGEMLDHPAQAGVQEIENMIFLEICDTFGTDSLFKFGKHDSQTWAFVEARFEEATVELKRIAQPTLTINGVEMYFPASFKLRLA